MSERARRTDPDTSHAAAAKVNPIHFWRVLAAYASRLGTSHFTGITDHDAYDIAGLEWRGARQRCSELREAGYTVDVGRGLSPYSNTVMLCSITYEGLTALAKESERMRKLNAGPDDPDE